MAVAITGCAIPQQYHPDAPDAARGNGGLTGEAAGEGV
jgi:hypothetical protein